MFFRLLMVCGFLAFTANTDFGLPVQDGSPETLPPYLYVQNSWIDSMMNTMTPDERIGQLFMVAAFSDKRKDTAFIGSLIRDMHIGGIIFMQGSPVAQAQLTNYYQSQSRVPLFIAQDVEWGLSMRIDSTITFPKQLALGAITDNQLIYDFGKEMARECHRIGVNISFSPVVDVNSNPLNPVIGDRSFGENKMNVARKGIAYMQGLQDGHVLACAKHFPGHGDTEQDSHETLPRVEGERSRLDSLELLPFKKLIDAGVGSVMVAHLTIPALDTSSNLPASLSPKIVTGLLKREFDFQGLSFTDALNMKGVTDYYPSGTSDLMALLAGNDVLLFPGDVPTAISNIKTAISKNEIAQQDIDVRVHKILQAKFWMGLSRRTPVETANLYHDLNDPSALILKKNLMAASLTLIRNVDNLIPFTRVDTFKIATVSIGSAIVTPFQEMIGNYVPVMNFNIPKDAGDAAFRTLRERLAPYDLIFVSLHDMRRSPQQDFGINGGSIVFLNDLYLRKKCIVSVFGNPYALKNFDQAKWLLECYNDDEITQRLAAQLLFGAIPAMGELPVTASFLAIANQGVRTVALNRVRYGFPEEQGMSSSQLSQIDEIVNEAMMERAMPGCQLLVMRNGMAVMQKSYGTFTYDAHHEVTNDDLYDLASITKIAATTLMVMKLSEEGKLNVNDSAVKYLPELKGTDKTKITIKELLTHESGFRPYFRFYESTLDSNGFLSNGIFTSLSIGEFDVMITPDIYMDHRYTDSLWKVIIATPLQQPGHYIYSDNDFYLLKKIAENAAGQPLDQYMTEHFYRPLGLGTMCFNPLEFFPRDRIVPSNYDYVWRKELIQGTVHDQGAAMLGGVGGHAGLFSDANDLGILMQMLLNNGSYAGKKYLDSATVAQFTSRTCRDCRRGLGFDKPETDLSKPSPTCSSASPSTYGHQGFTGTCVWVDPTYNLVYVFLSNRTFPDDSNGRLSSLSARTRIQQVIYESMKTPGSR